MRVSNMKPTASVALLVRVFADAADERVAGRDRRELQARFDHEVTVARLPLKGLGELRHVGRKAGTGVAGRDLQHSTDAASQDRRSRRRAVRALDIVPLVGDHVPEEVIEGRHHRGRGKRDLRAVVAGDEATGHDHLPARHVLRAKAGAAPVD
jgi:hypothetical protein